MSFEERYPLHQLIDALISLGEFGISLGKIGVPLREQFFQFGDPVRAVVHADTMTPPFSEVNASLCNCMVDARW